MKITNTCMSFTVELSGVDADGRSFAFVDAWDKRQNRLKVIGKAKKYTSGYTCLYRSAKTANDVKEVIEYDFRKLVEIGEIRKFKVKVVREKAFPYEKSAGAYVNGACRYYNTFCV